MNLKKISLFLIASIVLCTTENFAKFRVYEPQSENKEGKAPFKRQRINNGNKSSAATRNFSRTNSSRRQRSMRPPLRPITHRGLSTPGRRAHSIR